MKKESNKSVDNFADLEKLMDEDYTEVNQHIRKANKEMAEQVVKDMEEFEFNYEDDLSYINSRE